MNRNLIIPLPPGSEAEDFQGVSKKAVGFYPCINSDRSCTEYLLVKLDTKGRPYANCSKGEISHAGCTRSLKGKQEDVPEQTFEAFERTLELVSAEWPVAEVYKHYLHSAWTKHLKETQEADHDRDA